MSVLPRPEVINAWVVTGEVDVVLNVMTRTVGEYEQICAKNRSNSSRSSRA